MSDDTVTDTIAAREAALATVVIPHTGEEVTLTDRTTTDLADLVTHLGDVMADVGRVRQYVIDHVAGRLDLENVRKTTLDAGDRLYELETNAPASEDYRPDELKAVLEQAVADELISPAVVTTVVGLSAPPPFTPTLKVSKRELNKLLARAELARRVAAVRVRQPNKRTLKIKTATKAAE